MGGISTSTGLVSGLPIHDIVEQLMQVEARPRDIAARRTEQLQSQQSAYQELNSALLAVREGTSALTRHSTFRSTAATSSNENVLTASTGPGAVPGNYNFHVQQLVSAQQNLTRGFGDIDQTALGASTLTFDRGGARLEADTELARLNGGEGIERGRIRITDRAGNRDTIDLSTAVTVRDVISTINEAIGVDVTASIDGDRIVLTDNTGQTTSDLRVENVGGRHTATTLGLAQSVGDSTLTGTDINTVGRATALGELNDSNGISSRAGDTDFRIHSADGSTFDVDITGTRTLGEIIDRINDATGGHVTAAIGDDGVSLKLTDTAGGGNDFEVTALNGSEAARDLGILANDDNADGTIAGERLVAAMNSKLTRLLNGGEGLDLGTISITDRAGTADDVDLTGAHSVSDIIARINASDANVTAELNSAGNGIVIRDHTGGSGDLSISDVTGAAADGLNLAGDHDQDRVDSGALNLQYIAKGSRLERLGVGEGSFIITDSTGKTATINLGQINARTVGDVIDEINVRGVDITARINDAGNGIVLVDDAGGPVPIKVEEAGGTVARDLGLLGEAPDAGADLDGSFARSIEIDADDTLQDLVNKINAEGMPVRGSIVNDGSGANPYRLLLAAREGGTDHAFVFDDGGLGLEASMFSRARDATVFFGSADPAEALALRSRSNQLEGVIPDTTINLNATSRQPVQLTIERDHDEVVSAVGGFVESFNGIVEKMGEYDFYDAETNERGLLLGDSALNNVRRTLYNQLNMRADDIDGPFRSLTELGITVGEGGVVEFDESALRSALNADHEAVRRLFTLRETQTDEDTGETETIRAGLGVRIHDVLNRLTDREHGNFNRQINSLDRQIDLSESRVESLNERLQARRRQLLSQFFAMEQAIASMQQQGEALAGLQSLAQQSSLRNR